MLKFEILLFNPRLIKLTSKDFRKVKLFQTSNWLLRATVNLYPFQQCKDIFEKTGKKLAELNFVLLDIKEQMLVKNLLTN